MTPLRPFLAGTSVASAISAILIVFALGFFYVHFFRPLAPHEESVFFMGAVLALTFVVYPLRGPDDRGRWARLAIDAALVIGAVACAGYLIANWTVISGRAGAPARPWDIGMAVLCTLVTLEATRRVMPILVPVALLFLAYVWLGRYIPGYMAPPRISVSRLTQVLYLSNNGFWGSGLKAGFQYIMPYLILGGLLKVIGVMDVITAVALRFLRGTIGAGAKLAVVGSAFFGMLSGSSVSNVAFSGTFSIPMMRRNGFTREFAAAVEAGASTAGSLTPPVMGLAAFVMVEFTGISYARIALAAAVPALIYYVALFLQVHLKSREMHDAGRLVAMAPDEEAEVRIDLRYVVLKVLPILFVLGFLIFAIIDTTAARAAYYTCLLVIPVSFLMGREHWLTFRRIAEAMIEASRGFIYIGAALVCTGIMLGVVSATGVGIKISEIMRTLTGGSLLLLLVIAAANLIVLGMGLGGVMVYIIGAIMLAPAMIALGIDMLSAHFFIFYIAQLVTLVPPVCMTIFAAITLAESKTGETIVQTLRITAFVFLLPFLSVFHPELLFVGAPLDIASASAIALIASLWLVISTNRNLWGPLGIPSRAVFGACAAVLFFAGNKDLAYTLPALAVGGLLLAYRWLRFTRAAAPVAAVSALSNQDNPQA